MDTSKEIAIDLRPVIVVYNDGTFERLGPETTIPPSLDPTTGVNSKDITIDPSTGLAARIYHPENPNQSKNKLTLLVYFHGGAFIIGSAFSIAYHPFLNYISSKANAVIVSVNYRLAPEHKIPAAYDDCWQALQWIINHANGVVSEPWLSPDHVDYSRVFLAGDSAGGNIAHNLALKAGEEGLMQGVEIEGVVLLHPYFWGVERLEGEGRKDCNDKPMISPEGCDKMWPFISGGLGNDDPRINPVAEGAVERLKGLGCRRVLVEVAEKDSLSVRGKAYGEELRKIGWKGKVEVRECEGEDHVFFLFKPLCEKAERLRQSFVEFLKK